MGHPAARVDAAHWPALVTVGSATAHRRWVLVAIEATPRRHVLEEAVATLHGNENVIAQYLADEHLTARLHDSVAGG